VAIGDWNEDELREFVRRELRGSDLATLVHQLQGPSGVLFDEVTTHEATANAGYTALATAGPSIVLPSWGGLWIVEVGATIGLTSAGNGLMSYDIGGTGAVDADAYQAASPSGTCSAGSRARKKNAGAVTLTAKYRAAAGTPSFGGRWIRATPVRV
jgi:hypothetical protein